jgi:putative hemolysin
VRLLSLSTEGVLRLLRVRQSDELPVSEEEITVMIEQGRRAGVFKNAEQEVIENVFWLDERSVVSLMTPRREVVWLDLGGSPDEWLRLVRDHDYSRFVVARGSLDNLVGVVHTRRLLLELADGELTPARLESLTELPVVVPETAPALKLFERFKSNPVHLAVVVDEYGSVEGIVTLNDLSSALLGELALPEDEGAFVLREDGSWLIDGRSSVDEVQERLELSALPGSRSDYETLGGMVTTYLGHIPKAAESFVWEGYRFEVIDMDGARVDKMLVSRQPGPNEGTPPAPA